MLRSLSVVLACVLMGCGGAPGAEDSRPLGMTPPATDAGSAEAEATMTAEASAPEAATSDPAEAAAPETGTVGEDAGAVAEDSGPVTGDAAAPRMDPPTFSPPSGKLVRGCSVHILCAPALVRAVSFYTSDGTMPTETSASGTNALNIQIDGVTTLTAICSDKSDGFVDSAVSSASYTVVAPTPDPPSGCYSMGYKVPCPSQCHG